MTHVEHLLSSSDRANTFKVAQLAYPDVVIPESKQGTITYFEATAHYEPSLCFAEMSSFFLSLFPCRVSPL
jgi:hypothetical protein